MVARKESLIRQESIPPFNRERWQALLSTRFDKEEFRAFIYDMGIDFDDLSGREDLAKRSASFLDQLGERTTMLLDQIKKLRPDVSRDYLAVGENGEFVPLPELLNDLTVGQLTAKWSGSFDDSELHDICYDLQVGYDDLPGEGKAQKAKALTAYLNRRTRINDLVETVKKLRPNIDLPTLQFQKQSTEPVQDQRPSFKNLVILRKTLIETFDENELKTLCFNLGLNYDDLPGERKSDKGRELIAYFDRRGQLSQLVSAVREARPKMELSGENVGISPKKDIPATTVPSSSIMDFKQTGRLDEEGAPRLFEKHGTKEERAGAIRRKIKEAKEKERQKRTPLSYTDFKEAIDILLGGDIFQLEELIYRTLNYNPDGTIPEILKTRKTYEDLPISTSDEPYRKIRLIIEFYKYATRHVLWQTLLNVIEKETVPIKAENEEKKPGRVVWLSGHQVVECSCGACGHIIDIPKDSAGQRLFEQDCPTCGCPQIYNLESPKKTEVLPINDQKVSKLKTQILETDPQENSSIREGLIELSRELQMTLQDLRLWMTRVYFKCGFNNDDYAKFPFEEVPREEGSLIREMITFAQRRKDPKETMEIIVESAESKNGRALRGADKSGKTLILFCHNDECRESWSVAVGGVPLHQISVTGGMESKISYPQPICLACKGKGVERIDNVHFSADTQWGENLSPEADRIKIRKFIHKHFTTAQIEEMGMMVGDILDVGFNAEDLLGGKKADGMSREIITFFERRKQLPILVNIIRSYRQESGDAGTRLAVECQACHEMDTILIGPDGASDNGGCKHCGNPSFDAHDPDVDLGEINYKLQQQRKELFNIHAPLEDVPSPIRETVAKQH